MERSRALRAIKLLHTAVWLFFVGCILMIPLAAAWRQFFWVEVMIGLMLAECAVIGLNHGRCPLTDVAACYTEDCAANFDIYLPEWLARNNKTIFGTLFVADLMFLVWQFTG